MKNCLFVLLYCLSWPALLRILHAILPQCASCAFSFAGSCLLGAIIAYYFYPILKRSYFDGRVLPHDKAVFITGCDTGFGHELAKRLDSKGFIVFASCLFPEGEGAKKLKEVSSDRLHVLGLDVGNDESVSKALEYVKSNLGNAELWALVNNAGILKGFDIALTKTEYFKEVLNINTFGHVRTTKAFLPLLIKSTGRIVNVTSLASRSCLPHMAAYNMSKYAARAFSETLRQEMHPWGIKVIEIEPEGFRTQIAEETAILSGYEKVIQELDEETKASYGDVYFQEFKKQLHKTITLYSPKVYKVLDSLEDAVCLVEPCSIYKPCRSPLYALCIFVDVNLPAPIHDFIIRLHRLKNGFPIPKKAQCI